FPDSPRPGYGVVADVLVSDAVREQLRRETGVELKNITIGDPGEARPLRGSPVEDTDLPPSRVTGMLGSLFAPTEFRDWNTGKVGSLMITSGLSVAELYDRISTVGGNVGRTFAQGLLLVLFIIGALFLIIEFMALIAGLALARSITGSVHSLFTGTERVRQGDFTHKIAVSSDDQLGELAGSFNSMTASIEDLLRQAAEKK